MSKKYTPKTERKYMNRNEVSAEMFGALINREMAYDYPVHMGLVKFSDSVEVVCEVCARQERGNKRERERDRGEITRERTGESSTRERAGERLCPNTLSPASRLPCFFPDDPSVPEVQGAGGYHCVEGGHEALRCAGQGSRRSHRLQGMLLHISVYIQVNVQL